MPFIHPALFSLGLGLVSLPIVIHLLNRRRFTVRPWAAMQFLLESVKRNRRRLRIEELILLALRCLIILALAAGIARLTGCGAMNVLPGSSGTHTTLFVLDDSYSMSQKVASAEIFRAAATDLANEIGKLPKSDKVAIILASDPANADPYFKLTHVGDTDLEALHHRLGALKPSDRRANPGDALVTARQLFTGEKGQKRLYLLGDFRKRDLADRAAADTLRGQFKAMKADGVDVVVLDYGLAARNNLTVESIELLDKFVVATVDMRLRVSVRNYSPNSASDVRVTVSAKFAGENGVREVKLPVRVIDTIGSEQVASIECKITPPSGGGSAVISVAIGDDELAGDNRAHLALEIIDALKVLIADGRVEIADPMESESTPLAFAIDSDSALVTKVIPADGMSGEELDEYDLVVMVDVGDLPGMMGADGEILYPQLKALERYVRSGGGLAIFTGDKANLAFYNGPMYAAGVGLSPYRIGTRVGDPRTRNTYFRLDPKSIKADLAVRQFQGDASVCTSLVRFYAFTPAKATSATISSPEIKAPRVLARFTDPENSPAIAVRQFGKGTVMMYYTTASLRWNDWAVDEPRGIYVAPMLDMVAYLARSRRPAGSLYVGQSIALPLSRALRDAGAELRTPGYPDVESIQLVSVGRHERLVDEMATVANILAENAPADANALRAAASGVRDAFDGRDIAAAVKAVDAGAAALKGATMPQVTRLREELAALNADSLADIRGYELRYERVREAGVYELELQPLGADKTRTVFFARNVDPLEGDLAPGGLEALVTAFGSRDFLYFPRQQAAAVTRVNASMEGEYWVYAIVAVLLLLVIENYLGWRFGHYTIKNGAAKATANRRE